MLLIGAAGVALSGTSAVLLFRKGPSAAEKERQRLQLLHQTGRIAHGEIEEIRNGVAFYSYEVAGVTYTAAQDLKSFTFCEDNELPGQVGQVIIKYDRGNPLNSMIHCEWWSGMQRPNPMAAAAERI